MSVEFCPELQRRWSIENISICSLNEINIILAEYNVESPPVPLGRHARDTLTWPTILHELTRIELNFSNCVYFNIKEEMYTPSLAREPAEGQQFQRLLDSQLIRDHTLITEIRLVHYRIFSSDGIIDILTTKPPQIKIHRR